MTKNRKKLNITVNKKSDSLKRPSDFLCPVQSLLHPLKLSMPDGVSEALKNIILQSNITQYDVFNMINIFMSI